MNYLTADEQKEVRMMEELFGSPGWKRFVEIQGEILEDLPKRALYAKDETELFFLKGQFHVIQQLVDYEGIYFKSAEELNTQRQVEADQASADAVINRAANA